MKKLYGILFLGASVLCTANIASAQTEPVPTVDELRQQIAAIQTELLDIRNAKPQPVATQYFPGVTSNIPTGFGSGPGSWYLGAGFHNDGSIGDGAISTSYGFGNPTKSVGVNASLSILDISNFGDRGALSFHLFHQISDSFSVAAGYENGITWGDTDSGHTVYAVASKVYPLKSKRNRFNRLYVTAGLGNGRFQTDDDFNADNNKINPFGGLTTNINARTNAFAEWTGKALNLGVSYAVPNTKLTVTPAITDVTDRTDRGIGASLGISYPLSLGKR